MGVDRCDWAGSDPLMLEYHDRDWGVPVWDDRTLFEVLVLEGAQAGLSWAAVLRRRAGYREAFEGFDAERVARFGPVDVERLLASAAIIRNRRKIESAIGNARALLAVAGERGTFAAYAWEFVGGRPRQNRWRALAELPATTPESTAMSKDMSRRGFSFVGPTICYAFMQSCGLVNDHTVSCFRYAEVAALATP